MSWDVYEIKGNNSKQDGSEDRDHISDLAFQTIVLERGVNAGRSFIVHLDKHYARQGAIDIDMLFIKDDSTEQVAAARAQIAEEMAAAKEYLGREEEPGGGCDCHIKDHNRHSCAFAPTSHAPAYSVHDIVRKANIKLSSVQILSAPNPRRIRHRGLGVAYSAGTGE